MGNCLSSSAGEGGGRPHPIKQHSGETLQQSPQPVVGEVQGISGEGLAPGPRQGLPSFQGALETSSIPPDSGATILSSVGGGAAVPLSFALNAKANTPSTQPSLRRLTGTSASGSSFAFNAPSSPGHVIGNGGSVDVGAVLMELSRGNQSGVGTPQRGGSGGTEGEAFVQGPEDVEHQHHAQQLTVTQLNEEIQDLRFIGSGASGNVYRGQWQGATVAVKYIVTTDGDTTTAAAAANEAVLGRLLAHPNVVQTFSAKTITIDGPFFDELNRLVELHKMLEGPGAADDLDGPPLAGGMIGPDGTDIVGTVQGKHSTLEAIANGTIPVNSYISGEGFGNPLTKPPSVLALQDVLQRANARPGNMLTQIVMEYCDKGSLLQAINRGLFKPTNKWGSKLALRALLRTAREVAQGMLHIHQANVVHGDLKPGNVLLKGSRADRRGFVAKISDFGLSRMSDKASQDDSGWGTVHYMAPEAFEGVITKQADVYAFGVCLWQMVSGEKPYTDLHPGQVIVGVQTGTLSLEWPPETHSRLLRLGLACLSHDRKQRPLFNYIMKELSLIESMVRLEGANGGDGSPAASNGGTARGGSNTESPCPSVGHSITGSIVHAHAFGAAVASTTHPSQPSSPAPGSAPGGTHQSPHLNNGDLSMNALPQNGHLTPGAVSFGRSSYVSAATTSVSRATSLQSGGAGLVAATMFATHPHLQDPQQPQSMAVGGHTGLPPGTPIADVLVASSESSSTHGTAPALYKTTSNAASHSVSWQQQSSGCDSPLASPRPVPGQEVAAAGQQVSISHSQGSAGRPGSQGATPLGTQIILPTHVLLARPPRNPPTESSPFASHSSAAPAPPAAASQAAAAAAAALSTAVPSGPLAGVPTLASVGPSPLGQQQQVQAVNGTSTPPPLSGRRSLHRDPVVENGSSSLGSSVTGGSQATYGSSRTGVGSVTRINGTAVTPEIITSLRTASSSSLNPSYEQIASMMQLGGRGHFTNGPSRLQPSGSLPAGTVAPAAPSSPQHPGSGPVTPALSQLSAEQIGRRISGGPSGRLGRLGSSSRPSSYEVGTLGGGVVVGAGSSGGGNA